MGDIVNLREFRKKRARKEKSRQAAVNREKFGRPKIEIERSHRDRDRSEGDLDGKRLEDDDT